MAYDSVRLRIAVLRLTGSHMERRGYLNPTKGLRLHRTKPVSIRHWSGEQLMAFLEWTKQNDPSMYAIRLLQGLCGLRVYEAGYIREQDIDWTHKTITVAECQFHSPKNLPSYRVLPVGDYLLNELRFIIQRRQGKKHEGFLTVNRSGRPYPSPEQLRDDSGIQMRAYMKKHAPKGTPYITAKDLRKTFATLLELTLRANGTAQSFYLGQSNGGIRHTHYTAKYLEFMREEIAEKVEG